MAQILDVLAVLVTSRVTVQPVHDVPIGIQLVEQSIGLVVDRGGEHDNLVELREVRDKVVEAGPLCSAPAMLGCPVHVDKRVVEVDNEGHWAAVRLRQWVGQELDRGGFCVVLVETFQRSLGAGQPTLGPRISFPRPACKSKWKLICQKRSTAEEKVSFSLLESHQ